MPPPGEPRTALTHAAAAAGPAPLADPCSGPLPRPPPGLQHRRPDLCAARRCDLRVHCCVGHHRLPGQELWRRGRRPARRRLLRHPHPPPGEFGWRLGGTGPWRGQAQQRRLPAGGAGPWAPHPASSIPRPLTPGPSAPAQAVAITNGVTSSTNTASVSTAGALAEVRATSSRGAAGSGEGWCAPASRAQRPYIPASMPPPCPATPPAQGNGAAADAEAANGVNKSVFPRSP